MRGARWAMYLWPGLPDLWWRGAWSGLAFAATFAAMAALVVSATWVWDELLGSHRGGAIWTGFAVGWLSLLAVSLRRSPQSGGPTTSGAGAGDVFLPALVQYLRGNWVEAELEARRMLTQCASDVEAALLLAAVLRHTNRFDEARETLDAIVLWDRAAEWQAEIDNEYQRLSEKQNRLLDQPAQEPEALDGPPPEEEVEQEMQVKQEVSRPLPEWRRAA